MISTFSSYNWGASRKVVSLASQNLFIIETHCSFRHQPSWLLQKVQRRRASLPAFHNPRLALSSRECKPGGYFSNPGLRVWRPQNPGTRVPGFDYVSPAGGRYSYCSVGLPLVATHYYTWFGVTPNHFCLSLWHIQTRKPSCHKETARCLQLFFRFKVCRRHSLQV